MSSGNRGLIVKPLLNPFSPLPAVNHSGLKIQSKFKLWDEPGSSGSLPPDLQGANSPDRRKDRRFDGELCYDATAFAVQIADISGSGALVFIEDPPPAGSRAELWIEDFDVLPIQIIHAGEYLRRGNHQSGAVSGSIARLVTAGNYIGRPSCGRRMSSLVTVRQNKSCGTYSFEPIPRKDTNRNGAHFPWAKARLRKA
jgi:hypothetical protein